MTSAAPILIVGAGPVGLSLACALADVGLPSTVLDSQPLSALAEPAEDGREIALTHRGMAQLQRLGAWQDLAPSLISPLRAARVYDGSSPRALAFDPPGGPDGKLGALVPNQALRRAAWLGAQRRSALITLRGDARVQGLSLDAACASLQLADGERLQAPLVVAADSRFSSTRRLAGIATQMLDFGRSVQLARIGHERPHQDLALECFHHGHTMAWLPLGAVSAHTSSLVLTLDNAQAERMRDWDDARWLDWVQTRSQGRLGALRLVGPRHSYPLVATYAQRFVAPRFALVGDAAVGMHPVTAHGYNFGLYGCARLAEALARPGVALDAALAAYEQGHRRDTWALYQGTNAVVRLFTDERAPLRLLRRGVLELAQRLPPLKALITAQLTTRAGAGGSRIQV